MIFLKQEILEEKRRFELARLSQGKHAPLKLKLEHEFANKVNKSVFIHLRVI